MSSETQVAQQEQQTVSSDAAPITQEVSWKDSLPADLKTDKSLESIKDIASLAKSYIHAQRLVGVDKIPIPNKHATPEDWQAVYSKLGRPDKPEGYKINFKEGTKVDDATLNAFKSLSHKSGLLPNQAQAIVDFYNDLTTKTNAELDNQAKAGRTKAEQELKSEWGNAYDAKLQSAANTAVKYIGADFAHLILSDGTKVGDHPTFVKAFASIAKDLGEDSVVQQSGPQYMTPKELDKQIAELQQPGSAYWSSKHPNHRAAVQEVQELMALKYPTKQS